MKLQRINALLGAAVVLAASVTLGASPAQAATRSLTAQSTYTCQSHAPAQGDATDKVTLRMQLDVPTSVAPGQSLTLGGILTMQFNQRLYESSKDYGIKSVEGYSTTISATSLVNGKRTVIKANRFQTSPAPVSDPIVVSAPITFPAYTVPADAKGDVTLGLPANGTTPNPASSNPPTVAFTVYANASSPIGPIKVVFACQIIGSEPGTLGKIPVRSRTAPAVPDAPAAPQQGQGGGGGSAEAPTTAPTAGAGVGSPARTPVVQNPVTLTQGPAATGQGAVLQQAGVSFQQPDDDRSGVYVPTGLLVFGGAAVCVLAVVYAAITNARLRMIKRSMEG